jgi:hypothetical protein
MAKAGELFASLCAGISMIDIYTVEHALCRCDIGKHQQL